MEKEFNLITINGLKRVVGKLNNDVEKLKGNPMMKIADVVFAFKKALINEEGKF